MPRITQPPRKLPHANAAYLNSRFLRGVWLSSVAAKKCCETVSCPRCRAAKGWPCSSAAGNDTSTPHSARWEKYRSEMEPPSSPSTQAGSTN